LHPVVFEWIRLWDEICRHVGLDESSEIPETMSASRHGVTSHMLQTRRTSGVVEGWAWVHVDVASALEKEIEVARSGSGKSPAVDPNSIGISKEAQYEIALRDQLDVTRVSHAISSPRCIKSGLSVPSIRSSCKRCAPMSDRTLRPSS
jgi:hypothetical protein